MNRRAFLTTLVASVFVPSLIAAATDLSVTAANVKPTDGTTTLTRGTAGEALTAGQSVYKHKTSGKWLKLDVDDTGIMANVSTQANTIGVVMFGGASTDEQVYVATAGPINIGATTTAGRSYYAADTLGAICPDDDSATGDVPVFMGTSLSNGVLFLAPSNHKTAL